MLTKTQHTPSQFNQPLTVNNISVVQNIFLKRIPERGYGRRENIKDIKLNSMGMRKAIVLKTSPFLYDKMWFLFT